MWVRDSERDEAYSRPLQVLVSNDISKEPFYSRHLDLLSMKVFVGITGIRGTISSQRKYRWGKVQGRIQRMNKEHWRYSCK
jgi:hypothetical protein